MLRAVIYARCSTEEESQKDALIKQVEEAKECVQQQGWILVDAYIESKSGTSTKNRGEYNRLFDDLSTDKFDIVVIKSQDRLMRNVFDWYMFVDHLTKNLKKLYLYIEHKFYTADDALITGVKAILAEDYSRELSKKINNAHKNRQKHGGRPILTGNVYGLKKMLDGSYELIPEEAAIKVRMYELFAAGYGSRTVENILKSEGVVNRKGVPFTAANIRRMVRNPINKGIIVMNRSHYDFDTKRNYPVPEEEQYIYPDKVPVTVSEELWKKANDQIDKRAVSKADSPVNVYGKNLGQYFLSGKIICGICGNPYYRRVRRIYKDNAPVYDWKCKRYLETGRNEGKLARPQIRKTKLENRQGCDNVHLQEKELYCLLEEVFEKRYKVDKQRIVGSMIMILQNVLQEKDVQPVIEKELKQSEKIKAQLNVLLDKLLEGVISDEAYQRKQEQLEHELSECQKRLSDLEGQNAAKSSLKDRINHIEKKMSENRLFEKATIAGMLDEIIKIVVYPKHMDIYFSSAKMLNLSDDFLPTDDAEILQIEYGNRFNYREQQREDLQTVIEMMRKNPQITAKQIAEKVGISTSGVYQRINKLKKENRIRFVGKGGKGYWEILEE